MFGAFEGQYQPGEPPVIVLDQGTIQAAMDGDNDAYENGILISVVAHELGHLVIDDVGTQQSDGVSLPDYIRFRAEGEALAIVNSMRSEEHKYELQSLMRHSYAVFRLKKKK